MVGSQQLPKDFSGRAILSSPKSGTNGNELQTRALMSGLRLLRPLSFVIWIAHDSSASRIILVLRFLECSRMTDLADARRANRKRA